MNILLVGVAPFTNPLAALFERGGHTCTRYTPSDFLAARALPACEIFVEAENTALETKRAILERAPRAALLLSCALNASATLAASWTRAPERVVGFGVLPPIPETGTIELARGLQTNDAAWAQAYDLWRALGQKVVAVGDNAGLTRARIVCAIINEAFSALQEQVASPREIDLAMKLGTNYPRGPFEWGELIGLETVLGVMDGLYAEWRQDRYRPAPLLVKYVAAKMTPRADA